MVQVSLVATFFNKAPYVADVVASMVGQTGLDSVELILVDDGSTDATADELRRAAGGLSNARIIRTENGGPSAAINTGIAAATGTWVKFLDGDDVLRPETTRALIDAAEVHGCSVAFGAIAGYGGGDPADAFAALPADFAASLFHERPLERLVRDWQINPSQLLARREVLDRVGGADARVFIQDFSLLLRLAADGPFAEITVPVVLFPEAVDQRLTSNAAQILHDLNLATVLYLDDAPGVADTLRRLFLNRVWERAYKWASRHEGARATLGTLVRRTAFRLGLGAPRGPGLLAATVPFAMTSSVRLTAGGKEHLRACGIRHGGLDAV